MENPFVYIQREKSRFDWKMFEELQYSPDLALSVFCSLKYKTKLRGTPHQNEESVNAVTPSTWMRNVYF